MNTSDYLKGYFFAGFSFYNYPFNKQTWRTESFIHTPSVDTDSRYLKFSINRGMCPKGGCVSFAHTNLSESNFDVAEEWVNDQVWNKINFIQLVKNQIRIQNQ